MSTPRITSIEQLQVEKIRTLTEIEQCIKGLRSEANNALNPRGLFSVSGTFVRFISYGIMAVQTYNAIRSLTSRFRRK